MKTIGKKFIPFLAFGLAINSYAGFRDPLESQSGRFSEIEAPRPKSIPQPIAQKQTISASKTRAPSKMELLKSVGPLPSAPNRATASIVNKTYPAANKTTSSPIEKSGSLPGRENFSLPGVALPNSIWKPIEGPKMDFQVRTKGKEALHKFSQEARRIPLPKREYSEEVKSKGIVEKFSSALNPIQHKRIHTALKFTLAKISKIKSPPSPTHYLNTVRRIDGLFDGFYSNYPAGIQALWELSGNPTNKLQYQARDALFAGILTQSAGWPTATATLWSSSMQKRLDREERYAQILWKHLEALDSDVLASNVLEKANPRRLEKLGKLKGERANLILAQKYLEDPKLGQFFSSNLEKSENKDKVEILRAVSQLARGENTPVAQEVLHRIEAEGSEQNREEARLALARSYLKQHDYERSLAFYQGVKKTTKNRLHLLGEQSYAEFKSGKVAESLGKAVGLQSPYFKFGFVPDIHFIEIMGRQANCDFGGAEVAIQKFRNTYGAEKAAIDQKLSEKGLGLYEQIIAAHSSENPRKFERYLLQLSTVMENQKTIFGAKEELQKIRDVGKMKYTAPRPTNWDQFVASTSGRWGKLKDQLKQDVSNRAEKELKYLSARLKNMSEQIELIDLDLTTKAAGNYNLQSALNFPARKPAQVELDQEKLNWTFENEIWEDELEFLKMKNPSKCAAREEAKNL